MNPVSIDYSSNIVQILKDEIFAKYNRFSGDYLTKEEANLKNEIFNEIDKNSDRKISKEELKEFIDRAYSNSSSKTVNEFKILNPEIEYGSIAINNIKTLIQNKKSSYSIKLEIENFSKKLISIWDKDGDKKLTEEEFWDGASEFLKYDTDFNNYITKTDLTNKITGERKREFTNEKELFIYILNKMLVNSTYSLNAKSTTPSFTINA